MAALAYYTTRASFSSVSGTKQRAVLFYKPMRITMSKSQSQFMSVNDDIETHIRHVLSDREPANVVRPMQHLIFAVPKSMAPVLCTTACEMVGGNREHAIIAASAFHLMCSSAFIRDNLLLSDETKPEIHYDIDVNIALLTVGAITSLGFELLAKLNDSEDISERILKAVLELSKAMGAEGMVAGQYMPDGDEKYEMNWIHHKWEKKEGGLYGCSAACGAIIEGGTDEEVEVLRKYGFYVGMMHGVMKYGVGLKERKLQQVVEDFRCLATKELDRLQYRSH